MINIIHRMEKYITIRGDKISPWQILSLIQWRDIARKIGVDDEVNILHELISQTNELYRVNKHNYYGNF